MRASGTLGERALTLKDVQAMNTFRVCRHVGFHILQRRPTPHKQPGDVHSRVWGARQNCPNSMFSLLREDSKSSAPNPKPFGQPGDVSGELLHFKRCCGHRGVRSVAFLAP